MTEPIQLAAVIERNKSQVTVQIQPENISKFAIRHFSTHFDGIAKLDQRQNNPAPPFSSMLNEGNILQNMVNVIDTLWVINAIQKGYIKSLIRDIADIDNIDNGLELVTRFRTDVVQSKKLNNDDRILLLEMAAASDAYLKFMKNDGAQKVQNELVRLLGNDVAEGRSTACSVDWRGVWMGAVFTAGTSAAYGFYLGATAGTVTVPVLGTVAGAVGGAVFSGAVGFVSGAIGGIATSLLTTCTRSGNSTLQQTYASCDSAWEAFANNLTKEIPEECFVVTIPI